jgi:predicted Ser/Thr protein kinase
VNQLGLNRVEAERVKEQVAGLGVWKAYRWMFNWQGMNYLVKDVRKTAAVYRFGLGRRLLRQEARVYLELEGLPFIPRFYGKLDDDAIILEHVPAQVLGRAHEFRANADFYDRLQVCVNELHRRGIAHLDLFTRKNILVTASGQPMLIDFSNAFMAGTSPLSRKLLLPLLMRIDNSAILKYRASYCPESLSTAERVRYQRFKVWRWLWPFDRLCRMVKTAYNGPKRPT